ncbi:hypothetical protein ACFWDI_36385 [Streptomyces sp. NPDC060064]|uniref:hypothetical protein n=1 Tax=Streptomyces sp. NPDC060064 TaxID=3347049 RepID=UPI0036815251
MAATPWHASPRPNASPSGDTTTGEIRVPLELWSVDRSQGNADLVLSRVEAEHLHAHLSYLLRRDKVAQVSSARVSGLV